MKNLYVLLLLSICFLTSDAQQISYLSSYNTISYLSNPANAGLNGSNFTLGSRNQWHVGGLTPETYFISADGNFGAPTSGYGMFAYSDKLNILNRSGAYGTYSYRIFIKKKSILTFGLSFGLEQNNLKPELIAKGVPEEISLKEGITDETKLNGNFGIAYQFSNLNIGFAGYRLFENNSIEINENVGTEYDYFFKKHFLASASYRMTLKRGKFFVLPRLQVRMATNTDLQTDFNLTGYYKDKIWMGAGYRQIYGMDFNAGFNLFKNLNINYTYAYNPIPRNGLNKSTNEISLTLRFGKKSLLSDGDKDNVPDYLDREPETPFGCKVNKLGVGLDDDKDGVANCKDKEANTPYGAAVNKEGVALDTDSDGVIDLYDQDNYTPKGMKVDVNGVSIAMMNKVEDYEKSVEEKENEIAEKIKDTESEMTDTDNDNVPDLYDQEIETPHWKHIKGEKNSDASKCVVDLHGVATDSDGDGVMDCVDDEIFSPKGAKVNENGVALLSSHEVLSEQVEDSDEDGISDDLDLEPNTVKGHKVDQWGRTITRKKEPGLAHRVSVDEIEDHSATWDYYVVIGVFRYYNNLKNYQKYLLKNYSLVTRVLLTDQNYYYVWTKKVVTGSEAAEEIGLINSSKIKDYITGNPWIWKSPKP
ncbi:MAG: PorP/SprF family type IX secretion system membrane protein [Flavobacteriales bacterium]|nr:PorP/SprF family type IX secretion system membrane protein [Flavobacteriales bacterium]